MVIVFHPSLSGGISVEWTKTFDIAGAAGFDAIELTLPEIAHEGSASIRERLSNAGLAPGAVSLPVEFRRDERTFERDLVELPRLAKFAAAIGATTMYRSLPASSDVPKNEFLAILRRRVRACAAVLREYNLHFAVEVLGPLHRRREGCHELIWRLREAAAFAGSCGPAVGVLVDSWHWHHSGGTPAEIAELRDRILHVHVADAPDIAPAAIRDDRRLLPGRGVIDFGGFFRGLSAAGYNGQITPEIRGYRCPSNDAMDCASHALAAVRSVLDIELPQDRPPG